MPGPAPKRSEERRRRNQPDTPIRKAAPIVGSVPAPEAPEGINEIARDWFESLKVSGQSKFYEPSDWEAARLTAIYISHCLSGKPSAFMFGTIWSAMNDLGTTESARRKARIEIERKDAVVDDPKVTAIESYKERLNA